MSILKKKHKVKFDINNDEHLMRAIKMIKSNSWGADGCPFSYTAPYLSVVDEIKDKMIERFINTELNKEAHA